MESWLNTRGGKKKNIQSVPSSRPKTITTILPISLYLAKPNSITFSLSGFSFSSTFFLFPSFVKVVLLASNSCFLGSLGSGFT
ncbi:hypothetical protein K1719_012494 [Acacia pycnantha]|nr:hypothetical protein K1719_012494 [Acacia pycnantha]